MKNVKASKEKPNVWLSLGCLLNHISNCDKCAKLFAEILEHMEEET